MLKRKKQTVQLWTLRHLCRLKCTYWIWLSTAGTFILFLLIFSFLSVFFIFFWNFVLSCFRHWQYQYDRTHISSFIFCRYFPIYYMLCIVDDRLWNILARVYYYFIFVALQPSAGYGLLVIRGFLITHNDAPRSVVLFWTSDQLSQRPLPDNTQQTNIHALGGIRAHGRSRRAAVDLRSRPRGHWDRQYECLKRCILFIISAVNVTEGRSKELGLKKRFSRRRADSIRYQTNYLFFFCLTCELICSFIPYQAQNQLP
jgi:hypothetical protein